MAKFYLKDQKKNKGVQTVPSSPAESPRNHRDISSSYEDLLSAATSKKLMEVESSRKLSQPASESENMHNRDLADKYKNTHNRRYSQEVKSTHAVEKNNESGLTNKSHKRTDSSCKKQPKHLPEENKNSESVNLKTKHKQSPATEKNKEINNKEAQKETVKEEKLYNNFEENKTYASGPVITTHHSKTKKQSLPGKNLKEENSINILDENKAPVTKHTNQRSPSIFSFVSSTSSKKTTVEAKNKNLVKAVKEGKIEDIQKLLEAGANVNYQKINSGNTPLIIAMNSKKYEIALMLIKAGANSKKLNLKGEGAFDKINDNLTSAAMEGKAKNVETLLKLGANVNYQAEFVNNTALHYAANNNDYLMINILREAGADHKIKNLSGETPFDKLCDDLITAVKEDKIKDFDALLQLPINVNYQEPSTGNTPLHYAMTHAASKKYYSFAMKLLKAGADHHILNKDGVGPLDTLSEQMQVIFIALSQDIENFKQQMTNKIDSTRKDDKDQNIDEQKEIAKLTEKVEKIIEKLQEANKQNKEAHQDNLNLHKVLEILNGERMKQQQTIKLLSQRIADLEEDKIDQQKQTYDLKQAIEVLNKKTTLIERKNTKLDLENQKLCKLLEKKSELKQEKQKYQQNLKKITDELEEFVTDEEGSVIKSPAPETKPPLEVITDHTGLTYVQFAGEIPSSPFGQVQEYTGEGN